MTPTDDRTDEQRLTHRHIVIMTDRFTSGWGKAKGGASYAGWACRLQDFGKVYDWVLRRSDAMRVRSVIGTWRPSSRHCTHAHIYVVTDGHPALQ